MCCWQILGDARDFAYAHTCLLIDLCFGLSSFILVLNLNTLNIVWFIYLGRYFISVVEIIKIIFYFLFHFLVSLFWFIVLSSLVIFHLRRQEGLDDCLWVLPSI